MGKNKKGRKGPQPNKPLPTLPTKKQHEPSNPTYRRSRRRSQSVHLGHSLTAQQAIYLPSRPTRAAKN